MTFMSEEDPFDSVSRQAGARFEVAKSLLMRSGKALRWSVLAASTVFGWVGIAWWETAQHGHFDPDEAVPLVPLMIVCGVAGCGQIYAQMCGPAVFDARGRPHRALLRWWQAMLLIFIHVVVTTVISFAVDFSNSPAGAGSTSLPPVIIFGTLGWVIGPCAGILVFGIVAIAIIYSALGAAEFRAARRVQRGWQRARRVSIAFGVFGGLLALMALFGALPWLHVGPAGVVAGLIGAVHLFRQAIGLDRGIGGTLALVDRLAFLAGLVGVAQAVVVAIVVRPAASRVGPNGF